MVDPWCIHIIHSSSHVCITHIFLDSFFVVCCFYSYLNHVYNIRITICQTMSYFVMLCNRDYSVMYFGYQFVYSSYIYVCCIFTYAVTDYIFLQHMLAYGMIIFIINVDSYNCVLCDLLSHFSYFLSPKLLCQTPYSIGLLHVLFLILYYSFQY